MFQSTKKFGPISTSHRNWRAAYNENRDSRKCSYNHGYSRYVQFTFKGDLDSIGWVYDFGDAKFIKSWLDEKWDHATLISSTDPMIDYLYEMRDKDLIKLTVIPEKDDWGPGIEGSCKWLFDTFDPIIREKTKERVSIASVEVWEHENNSAIYKSTR